ncbi:MAG: Do family serine endopeptidase [Alphaproteobacteria bacterium]
MLVVRKLLLSLAAALGLVTADPAVALADRVVPGDQAQITLSFAPLVRQAAPAVVNVFARRVVRQQQAPPLFKDPFFRRFFGDDFAAPRRRQESTLGSGVIVDPRGLIVTNHHVIAGAEAIRVVLADRREFDAELVVDDERTDLAILRIEVLGDLSYVTLADSDEISVGDLVLAIGNPFGVGQTVTSGIVSALARTNVGITDFNFFIQTDAAINPGNSGGALLTMDGRLAGVNTAIFSRSGGSQGIGFAVPANMVRTVLASVGEAGVIMRPWLGAAGQSVNAEMAQALGLARPGGVVVSKVFPQGPAARAGIRPRDVIVAVDGHSIDDLETLRFRLATAKLGTIVPMEVIRQGRTMSLSFPLEAAPEDPLRDTTVLAGPNPFSGATVVNASPAVAEDLRLSAMTRGVVVTNVEPRSAASRIGLRPRDIVIQVNGVAVTDVASLRTMTAEPTRRWRLSIRRDGRLLSITVSS